MISTRLHGAVDYIAAGTLACLSRSDRFHPKVRQTLMLAGTFHAGYSTITDYEAGARPLISMRQHLALDAAGALAIIAAGLMMRRAPPQERAMLIGAGLLECAIVAGSSATPRSGPGPESNPVGRLLGTEELTPEQVGEPPLNTIKQVADDVFVVDSTMRGPIGLRLPVRMTLIRLPGGALIVHSPVHIVPGLLHQVGQLGQVRHLVAPDTVHWTFMHEWQDAYPDATAWGVPGLRERRPVQRSGLRIDRDLTDAAPPDWEGIELVEIPGGLNFREVALFHRPTRTLILTDLVQNLKPEQVPPLLRPLARLLGVTSGEGTPPAYLRCVIAQRRPGAAAAAGQLLALEPERVLFAHGDWFRYDPVRRLRRSLAWLLDGGQAAA